VNAENHSDVHYIFIRTKLKNHMTVQGVLS